MELHILCPLCSRAISASNLDAHTEKCLEKIDAAEQNLQKQKELQLSNFLQVAQESNDKRRKKKQSWFSFWRTPNDTSENELNDGVNEEQPVMPEEDTSDVISESTNSEQKKHVRMEKFKLKSRLEIMRQQKQRDPRIVHRSHVATTTWREILKSAFPDRYKFGAWKNVYSTQYDAIGLYTFYKKLCWSSTTVLIVEDSNNYVFGAFCTRPWRQRGHRYFGTGESFLFSLHPEFRTYHWTRQNDYFMLGEEEYIAVGGGGKFGIWLDEYLDFGSSGCCTTYGNNTLSCYEQFQCKVVEVWEIIP